MKICEPVLYTQKQGWKDAVHFLRGRMPMTVKKGRPNKNERSKL